MYDQREMFPEMAPPVGRAEVHVGKVLQVTREERQLLEGHAVAMRTYVESNRSGWLRNYVVHLTASHKIVMAAVERSHMPT